MNAFIALSLAGAASAQMVAYSSGSVAASDMPYIVVPSASAGSSSYGSGNAYATAAPSASYSAPPSQITTSASYDIYSIMPYSSFTAGGYSSLDCGYGYQKGSDGSCSKQSWVRGHFSLTRAPF